MEQILAHTESTRKFLKFQKFSTKSTSFLKNSSVSGPGDHKDWMYSKTYSYLCTYDLYGMFLMRSDPLRGQVGGGWALEIESFLGPLKWHRADRRVPFGAQKIKFFRAQPPSTVCF